MVLRMPFSQNTASVLRQAQYERAARGELVEPWAAHLFSYFVVSGRNRGTGIASSDLAAGLNQVHRVHIHYGARREVYPLQEPVQVPPS